MKNNLKVQNIVSGYDKKIILKNINLEIPKNKITVIIGANACGKSTLLKTMSRLITPIKGEVLLDEKEVHKYPPKTLAKNLGFLTQSPIVPEGITVFDLVLRGRFPYTNFLKGITNEDIESVNNALEKLGISDIANAYVDELSGGQRQRVWIALLLAQETDILLLDEPTTYLDISHQIEILDVLKDLNLTLNKTIVMVLHDINLSVKYADYIFALKHGEIISEGDPEGIITEELIDQIYDMKCRIIRDPVSNEKIVIPVGKY